VVAAALLVGTLVPGEDYLLEDERVTLLRVPDLAAIGDQLTDGDLRSLLLSALRQGAGSGRPVISERLAVQRFLPRFLHLSGAGLVSGPLREEIFRTYGLSTLGSQLSNPACAHDIKLCRSRQEQLRALSERVTGAAAGETMAIVCHTPSLRRQLEVLLAELPLAAGGRGELRLLSEQDAISTSRDWGDVGQVVLAETPSSAYPDLRLLSALRRGQRLILLASPEDAALLNTPRWRRRLLPHFGFLYAGLRAEIEKAAARQRARVAQQDNYIRQSLTFGHRPS
jgi:hypothetical protein